MVIAKLKCTKVPIICTNQTGRGHKYCNGSCTCDSQSAAIEYVEARQDVMESPVNNTQQSKAAEPLREIAALLGKSGIAFHRDNVAIVMDKSEYEAVRRHLPC